MSEQIPIAQAAAQLGVAQGTLRRFCREGMPHTPGHRGRGLKTMVSVDDVLQWAESPCDDRVLLAVADALPRVLGRAVFESWTEVDGLNKRALAGILAAVWYSCATSTLDHLRAQKPEIPDVKSPPNEIQRLLKIYRGV